MGSITPSHSPMIRGNKSIGQYCRQKRVLGRALMTQPVSSSTRVRPNTANVDKWVVRQTTRGTPTETFTSRAAPD